MIPNKYNTEINHQNFAKYLNSLKNKVYKLLPLREEGVDWPSYLNTIIIEVCGAQSLFSQDSAYFIELLCRLESIYSLDQFYDYRKTIFEILSFIDSYEVLNYGCD